MAEAFKIEEIEEKVILVGVSEQDGDDAEDSVAELAELVKTAGATVVGTMIQKRELIHPGTYIGSGKVAELKQLLEELGGEERSILLLDFRLKCGFDSLERYVVGNMLGDLLPDSTLLMTTGIDRDVLVLADAAAEPSLESAVQVLKKSSSGSRR